MDKKFLLRFGILFGIFAVILGAAYGCTVISEDRQDTPQINDPDAVYATIGGLTITNQMLWEEMRNSEGYNYLINMIDEDNLKTYIENVSLEQIEAEVEYLTYGTRDQELIAEYKADAEIDAEFQEIFKNRMYLAGYNPEDADDVKASIVLGLAKYNYAKDYILNADSEDELAISDEDIEAFYEDNFRGEACIVPVRFHSTNEALNLLQARDLVTDYNNTIVRYVGDLPIEDLASDAFTDDNTVALTDEEMFDIFIELYNVQTPWSDDITFTGTTFEEKMEEYCANYADIAVINYREDSADRELGHPEWDLAFNVFHILELNSEDKERYTYRVTTVGQEKVMLYKVSETEADLFADISDELKAEILDELLESKLTSANINGLIADLRDEEIEIFDPSTKLSRVLYYTEEHDNEGSKTVFATYGDKEITAQDLFEYMESKVGSSYALELGKRHLVLQSPEFEEKYGTDRDYLNSKNELVVGYVEQLELFKQQYSTGNAGVDPLEVSWKELLQVNFGTQDENDVIELVLMFPNLIAPFSANNLHDFSQAADFVQDQYDNYFSLDVAHLLLYVDFDGDYSLDDFSDFFDGLTPEEKTEFNLVKGEFESILNEKIEENMTFSEIVEEFQDASLDDVDGEWYAVKSYGFRMKTEPLSIIDYSSEGTLDDAFYAAVVDLYEQYNRAENIDAEFLYKTSITTSDFGVHKIRATKPESFERPSAMFSEEDPANPVYPVGTENDSDLPSLEQFLIYKEILIAAKLQEETDLELPDTVTAALNFYYKAIIDAQFGQDGYNLLTTEILLNGDMVEYTANNDEVLAKLENQLSALYYNQFMDIDGYKVSE